MNETNTVLCVDDEARVLEGLLLQLGRKYKVLTATGGEQALDLVRDNPGIAVILSDMRMPGMNGATFLGHARQLAPAAVRILFTGQADLKSSMEAVNDGQIFGFLSKPCAPDKFLSLIASAMERHRLLVAQSEQLEKNLNGCVSMLTQILGWTHPALLSRSKRIKQLVSQLALELEISPHWQVEKAALLSQLGCLSLPGATVEKIYYQGLRNEEEKNFLKSASQTLDQLLAAIPGVEQVREILLDYAALPSEAALYWVKNDVVRTGSMLLKVAVDFEELQDQGCPNIVETLKGRTGRYAEEVLQALTVVGGLRNGASKPSSRISELRINALKAGMILANDVYLSNGALLVSSGFKLDEDFLEKMQNYSAGSIREPIRIVLPVAA